ncbi:RHS repeat domain-containing protein, partial [Prevotella histicola]|uniref:RHS repeat domain-containing protein n=1 Tax=Prevotella histicola TaxID=470565 RepID=UPI001E64952B
QTPHPNTTPGTNPGAPVSWNDPSNPDDPQAGYGYIPNDTTKEETFFYHSDHLGSTSYITDEHANITQYDAYLPYGELLVDEHSSSEDLPYKFNGKQFDEETGLYYYGARYMNPVTSLWYGVDPLAEKYPTVGGYVYTLCNPVRFIDLKGKKPTTKEAALISKHVYGGSDAADTQRDLEKSGWKVSHMFDDLDLSSESGLKSQFYERTKNGKKEFCYAFAGTDFTSIGDDVTDVQQFFGGVPRQYSEAVSMQKLYQI